MDNPNSGILSPEDARFLTAHTVRTPDQRYLRGIYAHLAAQTAILAEIRDRLPVPADAGEIDATPAEAPTVRVEPNPLKVPHGRAAGYPADTWNAPLLGDHTPVQPAEVEPVELREPATPAPRKTTRPAKRASRKGTR